MKTSVLHMTILVAVLLAFVIGYNLYKKISVDVVEYFRVQNTQAHVSDQDFSNTEVVDEVVDNDSSTEKIKEVCGYVDLNNPQDKVNFFSNQGVKLLDELKDRRKQIDDKAKQLDLKEQMLEITYTKIEQSIAQLKDTERDIKEIIGKYNEHKDAQMRSLAKIYSAMKPERAANILGQLPLDISVKVIRNIKEAKVATILAKMDLEIAKNITQDLMKYNKNYEFN